MDFVEWAILGQHHLARGRWGRLVIAVLEETDVLGLGIDENTAVVYQDGVAEVVGASGALLIDVSGVEPGGAPRTASGIRLELLAPGDRMEVDRAVITRASGRTPPSPPRPGTVAPGAGEEAEPVPSPDQIAGAPFGRWALLHLLHAFAAGGVAEVALDGGARTLHLRTGPGFVGLADPGSRVVAEAGTPRGLSVGPLLLDLATPGTP